MNTGCFVGNKIFGEIEVLIFQWPSFRKSIGYTSFIWNVYVDSIIDVHAGELRPENFLMLHHTVGKLS